MLSKVTHGTSSDSIILVATVVLPDALPPQMPATNKDYMPFKYNTFPTNALFLMSIH
jgi:hypothetical protein